MTTPAIRSMVRAMQAAGCPAEQIVAAVCAFEDEPDDQAAARREKDRDRKRAERAKGKADTSEPVQRTTADAPDSADTADRRPPRARVLYGKSLDIEYKYSLSPSISVAVSGSEDFDRFWKALPSPNPAARASALAEFARLSPPDQQLAVSAAGRYASAYAAKPTTHPMSPVRFLRERCFEGFPAPSVVAEASAVLVRVDTPQWRAWAAHRGRAIPVNREGTGWHFPSEWPPSAQRGAA